MQPPHTQQMAYSLVFWMDSWKRNQRTKHPQLWISGSWDGEGHLRILLCIFLTACLKLSFSISLFQAAQRICNAFCYQKQNLMEKESRPLPKIWMLPLGNLDTLITPHQSVLCNKTCRANCCNIRLKLGSDVVGQFDSVLLKYPWRTSNCSSALIPGLCCGCPEHSHVSSTLWQHGLWWC